MLPFPLPAARGYVVALSGGADSRLLLELTIRAVLLRGDDPSTSVRAAHMHHGIRREEADRDEAFCRRICAEAGVPLTVERADIPSLSRESGESEETAARTARYAFFLRVMQACGFPVLLTAHNADDQLETVLFHLLRGSGTRGMAGIPAERSLGATLPDGTPLSVHRPLLSWSRREVLEGIAAYGLDYVTDSTNLADGCVRNRLRHAVIPVLEEITANGAPQTAAVRLGQAAREDEDALLAMAADRYRAANTPDGLPAAAVAAEPPAVGKRMIRLYYETALGGALSPARTLSAHHLEAILRLCRAGTDGQVSDPLPGHMRAEMHRGHLTFASCTPPDEDRHRPLCRLTAGLTVWTDASPRVTIEIVILDRPLPPPDDETVFASADFPVALADALYARTREAGDTILSHGMTKKLKKLICDNHIPTELRDRLPLLCLSDGTPLWYPAVAYRDGFPAPEDGPAVRVTIRIRQD